MIFIPHNTPSSKNSRVWTGRYFIESKSCKIWKELTKKDWEDNTKEFFKNSKPRVIGFHFVRKSKHKFDFINPMQTVQDEMKKFGWIEDDNMDELIPIPVPVKGNWYTYDKNNPGVFIFNEEELKEIYGIDVSNIQGK